MSRRLQCALAGAAMVLLAAPAHALAPAPSPTASVTDVWVTAHNDALAFWFEVDGLAGRNPDIHVAPGAEVHLHLRNNGTVAHNFWAEALGGITCCVPPNGTAEATVTMPFADTAVAYLCQPHESSGMKGHFVVGQGTDRSTPGPGLLPAVLAIAAAVALTLRKPFGGSPRRRTR